MCKWGIKLWMIWFSSLDIFKFSKFGTMIICKLKYYLRGNIYISFILAPYIIPIGRKKIKRSTVQKKSLLWMWNKCKTGHADPESSWHNCISFDWILMPIALMEWNQNGMNNTSLAPINVISWWKIHSQSKNRETNFKSKYSTAIHLISLLDEGMGELLQLSQKNATINNNCCFLTANCCSTNDISETDIIIQMTVTEGKLLINIHVFSRNYV